MANPRLHLLVPFMILLCAALLSSSGSLAADTQDDLAHAKSLSQAFRNAAKGASPSVVTVVATYKLGQTPEARNLRELLQDPRFRRLLPDRLPFEVPEDEQEGDGPEATHIGSGVILEAEGVVLTNNHVVERAEGVVVRLSDGSELDAVEIRTDWRSDLAILKVKTDDRLPAAKLGDSQKLAIGDWVIAIGSPFELEATVSAGIISAKNRAMPRRIERARLLQTDAAINPSNSGGPLVNLDGEVVGINTVIATTNGNYQGVGFAIPINQAKWIARELLEHGEVRRAWLGVNIGDLEADTASQLGLRARSGVLVVETVPDGPAELAGIQENDVIVEFGGVPVRAISDLQAAVEQLPIGSQQRIYVMRDGRRIPLDVAVAALPKQPE